MRSRNQNGPCECSNTLFSSGRLKQTSSVYHSGRGGTRSPEVQEQLQRSRRDLGEHPGRSRHLALPPSHRGLRRASACTGRGGGGAVQPSGLQGPTVRQGEWFPHSGAGAQGRKSPPAPSMGITRHLQAQKGETKQTERLRSVPAEGSRCKSIYKCHKRSNPKELLMAFCSENKGVHSNSVSCHCSDKERLSLTSSSLQKIRGT